MVIARVCASNGYRVVEATDGEDALRLTKAMSGSINLVVTDVDMPGLSGLELATEIRLMLPRVPVCFVSGRELPSGALADAENSGRTAFLMKPFDLAELLRVIRSLLKDQTVREGSRSWYSTYERVCRTSGGRPARRSNRLVQGGERCARGNRVATLVRSRPCSLPQPRCGPASAFAHRRGR